MLIHTHDANGEGVPDAIQDRFKLPPSCIVSFSKGWMVETTIKKITETVNKKLKLTWDFVARTI